jgi:hypothetical protein
MPDVKIEYYYFNYIKNINHFLTKEKRKEAISSDSKKRINKAGLASEKHS